VVTPSLIEGKEVERGKEFKGAPPVTILCVKGDDRSLQDGDTLIDNGRYPTFHTTMSCNNQLMTHHCESNCQ
jgi:hypothetical protein